jgi:hypothetical protein
MKRNRTSCAARALLAALICAAVWSGTVRAQEVFGDPIGAEGRPIGGPMVYGEDVGSAPIGGPMMYGEPVGSAPIGGPMMYGDPVGSAPIGGPMVGGEPVGSGGDDQPIGGDTLY